MNHEQKAKDAEGVIIYAQGDRYRVAYFEYYDMTWENFSIYGHQINQDGTVSPSIQHIHRQFAGDGKGYIMADTTGEDTMNQHEQKAKDAAAKSGLAEGDIVYAQADRYRIAYFVYSENLRQHFSAYGHRIETDGTLSTSLQHIQRPFAKVLGGI